MFKLPYSLLPVKVLRRISSIFMGLGEFLQNLFPSLELDLKQAEVDLPPKEYLSICIMASLIFFCFIGLVLISVLIVIGIEKGFLFGILTCMFLTFFVFLQQISYPKIYVHKKIRNIERNLLPALQNIMIQLNSGVPLFSILVNISKGDYGKISKEFSRAVKEINAGASQTEALEKIAAVNPSLFFRRAIWQLINGMKSGANMSSIIQETINLLSEEQVLQIQRYGSQLNPLAMFYMLFVIIGPSLGTTFLIMLSSFFSFSDTVTKMIFWSLFGIVVFFQIMFLGIIKNRRPNLLGN